MSAPPNAVQTHGTSSPVFPTEIEQLIIDHFIILQYEGRSCDPRIFLVCKAWCDYAKSVLWKDVSVMTTNKYAAFVETLDGSDSIRSRPRSMCMLYAPYHLPRIYHWFSRLTVCHNLQYLSVTFCDSIGSDGLDLDGPYSLLRFLPASVQSLELILAAQSIKFHHAIRATLRKAA